MSLVWADFPSGSAGLYSNTGEANLLNGIYAEADVALVDDPDPNITGTVVHPRQNDVIRKVYPSPGTSAGVALRIWHAGLPGGTNSEPIQFRSVTGTSGGCHVSVSVDTNGYIRVYRGSSSSGTLIGSSSGPVIVSNAWQHLEAKVLVSDTVGTVEVRLEGVPVVTITGADTSNNADLDIYSWAAFYASTASSEDWYIKDLVMWDTAGSINNTFFGSVTVKNLLTTGDSTPLDWTPSTGTTHYSLLDESPPSDVDYVSAATVGLEDQYTLTDLPVDVTSVKGLIIVTRSKKTDGGDGNIQAAMISAGDVGNGTDRAVTTSFTYYSDVVELDPDTSAAWTPTAVNAAEVRISRTL